MELGLRLDTVVTWNQSNIFHPPHPIHNKLLNHFQILQEADIWNGSSIQLIESN